MKVHKLLIIWIISIFLLSPAISFALPTVADIYLASGKGDYKTAAADILQLLQANPSNAKAHWLAANILYQEGQIDQSSKELAKAEKLSPSDSFANRTEIYTLKAKLYFSSNHRILYGIGIILVLIILLLLIWLASHKRKSEHILEPYTPLKDFLHTNGGIKTDTIEPMRGPSYIPRSNPDETPVNKEDNSENS